MFASILINTNAKELNRVFDYVVPKEYENVISIGARVFVPFGKGKNLSEGYVVDLMDSSEFANKEIASIEDSILTEDNVELAKLMAQKYFCNVADCIKLMLPPGASKKDLDKRVKEKTARFVYLNKEKDEIISFLICNNFGFDINEVDFDNIYREIEDVRFRHNMILSLQDGLLLYKFDAEKAPKIMKETFCKAFEENQVAWYFPHSTVGDQVYKCKSLVVEVDTEDVYNHIIHFLNGLKNAMFGQREYKIDIGSYLMDDAIKQRCR